MDLQSAVEEIAIHHDRLLIDAYKRASEGLYRDLKTGHGYEFGAYSDYHHRKSIPAFLLWLLPVVATTLVYLGMN